MIDSQLENQTSPQYPLDKNYETYFNERRSLLNAKLQTAQSFDKAILTLSGGALGLSFTFIQQVVPEIKPDTLYLLKISWASYCLSILTLLIAMLVSQAACTKQIKILEEHFFDHNENTYNNLSTITAMLNYSSIFFFIVGTASLAYFGIINFD